MNRDDTDRGHQGSKDTPALEGRHRQDRGAAAFSRQSDSSHTHMATAHPSKRKTDEKREIEKKNKRFEYSSTQSESSHTPLVAVPGLEELDGISPVTKAPRKISSVNR